MAVSGHVRRCLALAGLQNSSLVPVGNEVDQGTEVLDRSGQGQSNATWLDLFPFTVLQSLPDSLASPGQSSKDFCILGIGEVVSRSIQPLDLLVSLSVCHKNLPPARPDQRNILGFDLERYRARVGATEGSGHLSLHRGF